MMSLTPIVNTGMRFANGVQRCGIKAGDHVLFDPYSELLYEILPKLTVEETVLEEVPDVSYDDIGGLKEQVEQIKDAIELPYIYGHLFQLFQLNPPKASPPTLPELNRSLTSLPPMSVVVRPTEPPREKCG